MLPTTRCGGWSGVSKAALSPTRGATTGIAAGTAADETLQELVAALHAQAARSRAVVESHDLADIGQPGDGWDESGPASFERGLFHLVQEYPRHVGHLDIVSELADGQIGE